MRIMGFASGRISILHIIILLLSVVMTFSAWHFSKLQAEQRMEQRFIASRDRTVGLIKDRMSKYEDALWSGVAALESHSGDMTLDQWRVFAANLRIDERYPGINGIGVIHFVSKSSLAGYLAQRRLERPGFEVFPAHGQDIYMPISFIEPESTNAAAVGLDVAHEVNRRTAALASRDTGTSQITGPIVLVQDTGETPGFLFYAPFYRGGISATGKVRSDRITGVVYAPFVVRKLLDGLLSKELRHTSISISDGEQIIYNEHSDAEELHDPAPMFSQTIPLEIYGRAWSVDIRSNIAFRDNNTSSQPSVILAGGLVIEALIIALLIMMARANRNAITYADKVTEELKLEKCKLVRTNEELEQFAYAASHDLKTPIRGIAGLTEMVKEDLDDYLRSPNANPDVAMSLDLILDRVRRMNDLTSGIIEFSRIGVQADESDPLHLGDLVTSLIGDFDLAPHQVVLESSVDEVAYDPVGLRRVLENLVSNAVKYHDGADPLRIVIACNETSQSFKFSVKDNGPGIDPKFQERVFDMFQTLRSGDDPESTGIGLAIVKKAIELHGGDVNLQSRLGDGAEFTFQWPRHAMPSAVTESDVAA